MARKTAALGLAWILSVCSPLACGRDEAASDLNWSHTPAASASGSITALLAYQELDFPSDRASIRVCIQGSPTYKGAQLLLETKLAYAAWLDGSGRGSEENWERFRFEIHERCSMGDKEFSSHVIVASSEKADLAQARDFTIITCTLASCLPRAYTTGLGGAGAITYSYVPGHADAWLRVDLHQPSRARLSPYVSWQPLETELRMQLAAAERKSPAISVPAAQLQKLLSYYLELKDSVGTLSLGQLRKINLGLLKNQLDARASYPNVSTRKGESSIYRPQATGFHTLLHEVGHQFGMQHAHEAMPSLENGMIAGTGAYQDNGAWITFKATMAYENSYFFLTPDDAAGIGHLATQLYAFLEKKRG